MAQPWSSSSVEWWSSAERKLLRKNEHKRVWIAEAFWRTEGLWRKGRGKSHHGPCPILCLIC